MPFLVGADLLRFLPIPTGRNYMVISVFLLTVVSYHAYKVVTNTNAERDTQAVGGGGWQQDYESFLGNHTDKIPEGVSRQLLNSLPFQLIYFMLHDQLSIWALVNSVCCCVFALAFTLRYLAFGSLRQPETLALRDRFWNFVFHGFIFVFGVLNAQRPVEVIGWLFWLTLVGFVVLLTGLTRDRCRNATSSKATGTRLLSVFALLTLCSLLSLMLLALGLKMTDFLGLNYGSFLLETALSALINTIHAIFCATIRGRSATLEGSNWPVYYVDLGLEMSILSVDFLHHFHMLLWGHIFPSLASLVVLMQLKSLFQSMNRRMKRHRSYMRILDHMDQHYPMASGDQLAAASDQRCAVCWDQMESARQLPCGHYFHSGCLHNWLEQDTSCPTCRLTLVIQSQNDNQNRTNRALDAINHVFHFDGGRFSRWLPSFSIRIFRNQAFFDVAPLDDTQLQRMADQVSEMFPHIHNEVILQDLRTTQSVQITANNIIEGRLVDPDSRAGISDSSSGSSEEDEDSEGVVDEAPAIEDQPPPSPTNRTLSNRIFGMFSRLAGDPKESCQDHNSKESPIEERKKALIEANKRQYLESSRGCVFKESLLKEEREKKER